MLQNQADQRTTLYIGDLDSMITEPFLYNLFQPYGPIISLRIMKDLNNQKSLGFAFVQYNNQQSAEKAKQETNYLKIQNKIIRVSWKQNIREMSIENNIFIKQLPKSINEYDLEQNYSKFGEIFSLKIMRDQQGNSREYGYIQYQKQESALLCLQSPNLVIKTHEIQVCAFKKRSIRTLNENNLYFKNLPNYSIQEVEKKLEEICKNYGQIISICARSDSKQRIFAFVSFNTHQEANQALKDLQNQDPFNIGSNLYVSFSQKRSIRQKILEKQYQSFINDTNIFTKNLKSSVTLFELQEIFSSFGQTASCVIKIPNNPNIKTKYAFIDFKSKEAAFKCLSQGKISQALQQIYENKDVYLNLFLKRNHFENFKIQKNNWKFENFKNRFDPQMFYYLEQFFMLYQSIIQIKAYFSQNSMIQKESKRILPKQFPDLQKFEKLSKVQLLLKKFSTVDMISQNMKQFKTLTDSDQRKILGEILFPKVQKSTKKQSYVPRITGMLIDLEVFDIEDILDILKNDLILKERVQEAELLIDQKL